MPRWSGAHRARAADLAIVSRHIGIERGLVRIVALLEARRFDGKIERFAGGGRVLAEIPQAQAVVAIDRLDDIGLGVELHAHLAEIVAQQHADLAADRGIFEAWLPASNIARPLATKPSSSS